MDEIQVGIWRVEPQRNRISAGSTVLKLEPRVIDLLACLARRPGEVVSKRELLDRVWGDVHVTEGVLKRAIWELRRALGDDAKKPRWIETVPRRGYRLIRESAPSEAQPEESLAEIAEPTAAPLAASSAGQNSVRPYLQTGLAVLAMFAMIRLADFVVWPRSATEPSVPRPVTALEGRELHPALSGDGSRLAFTWNGGRGHDFDLYVKLIHREHLQRLTKHPGADLWPTWSRDGNHLAFVRQAADPTQSGVFEVSALGGEPRQLLAGELGQVSGLAWSPRGDELAVALAAEDRPSALYLLSLDKDELRPLTKPPADADGDRHPVFSPDGRSLAFVRAVSSKNQEVFRIDVASGREKRLTSDSATVLGLAWTQDGADVVFSSDRRGPRMLWQVDADGGGTPEWLPASTEGALHPSTDLPGQRLVFEQTHCDSNIRQVGASSSRTLIASTRRDQFPQLSPDGQKLAFVSTRGGDPQIYIASPDGAAVRRLTELNGAQITTLRWSPDSTKIVFELWHQGRGDVFVVELMNGQVRSLADFPSHKATPGWSADGELVYFGSPEGGSWQIWAVSAVGGSPYPVTSEGGRAAIESADGQWLYFTKYRSPGIWRRPVAGGVEEQVLEDFERDNGVDWVLVEDGIYYLAHRQGESGVAFFDFESHQISMPFLLDEMPTYGGLTLTPDRRSVLLTHVAEIESDVMLLAALSKSNS